MKKILVTGLLILGVASFSYAATSTSLRIGTTGEEVSVLQQNLRSAGISVAVTGSYDQKTAEAVKKFQLSQGLVADGIAGKTTRAKLTSTTTKTAPTTTNNIVPGGNTGTPWATICDDGLPHLQVLTPNGGEVYNAGDQIKVTWRTCNITAGETIYLGFDTTFPVTAFTIANVGQTNTGSGILIAQPSWFVPGGFQSGKYYKAFVYSDTATDNSNVTFTIKGTPWTQTDVCPNISGIQTTVPTGYILLGGQCVPGGTTSGSPTITTNAYSNLDVANGNIRFNGTFISNGSATTTYFEYQTVGGPIVRRPGINQGSTQIGSFNDDVINLTTANYQYRACGFNSYGTNCGDWIGFSINRSTSTQLPTVQTLSPVQTTSNSITLNGYYNMNNFCAGHTYFQYGLRGGTMTNSQITTVLAGMTGTATQLVTGLAPGTYQYRIMGDNCNGTVAGDWFTITLGGGTATTAACNDGIDNDGDGLKDYPADPGCASISDTDEYTNQAVSCHGLNVDNYADIAYDTNEPLFINQGGSTTYSNPFIKSGDTVIAPFIIYNSACDLAVKRIDISLLPTINIPTITGTYRIKDSAGRILGTATMPFSGSAKTLSIDLSNNPIYVAAQSNGKFVIEANKVQYNPFANNDINTIPAFSYGIKDILMINTMNGDGVFPKNYKPWVPVLNMR